MVEEIKEENKDIDRNKDEKSADETGNSVISNEDSDDQTEQKTTDVSAKEESAETEEEKTENELCGFAVGDTPDFKWYIAKTMTGQENKVVKSLRERVVGLSCTEFFADILTPEETVVSMVNGKKRNLKKKFFPGYVLIKMVMNDKTWHLVKDTDKITGFIGGTTDKPVPISNEEAAYMTNQAKDGFKRPRTSVEFSQGESVKVIEGPFTSFVGTVEAVNDKGKLKVNVSIFGRPTPVELDTSQVEKIN